MLYERSIAIFLVLVNVMLIACARIYPTVDNGNFESKISEDGVHNYISTNNGKILATIFEQHPRLAFLGDFNGKSWYIERTKVDSGEAHRGCVSMGMSLAHVNQAELDFIYSVTTAEDNYSWLGALFMFHPDNFRWTIDNSNLTAMPLWFSSVEQLSLVLDRSIGRSGVLGRRTNFLQYYICSHPTDVEINHENYLTTNEHLIENTSRNGHIKNPNAPDIVHISVEILERTEEFLGNFNGKSWYIERKNVDYDGAAFGCTIMGMTLAQANQAEINFLYSVTTDEDDQSWLGGKAFMSLTSFRWMDFFVPMEEIPFRYINTDPSLGLALFRHRSQSSENSGVLAQPTDALHYFICTREILE